MVGSSLPSTVGSIVNSDSVVGSIVSSAVGEGVEVSGNDVGSSLGSSVGAAVRRFTVSTGDRVLKLFGRRVRILNGVFETVIEGNIVCITGRRVNGFAFGRWRGDRDRLTC